MNSEINDRMWCPSKEEELLFSSKCSTNLENSDLNYDWCDSMDNSHNEFEEQIVECIGREMALLLPEISKSLCQGCNQTYYNLSDIHSICNMELEEKINFCWIQLIRQVNYDKICNTKLDQNFTVGKLKEYTWDSDFKNRIIYWVKWYTQSIVMQTTTNDFHCNEHLCEFSQIKPVSLLDE